ncbi:hypothetical protein SAMN04487946_101177 [Halobellus clavatus]|uniref:Uncharacterized protein n=1 Tax=Halobellus clavatus TaxID=660517 RepID=A0A1H3CSB9_9EURY|nr:hypothetical protein SAMN04487946_101177 [Halobellus clavatus]
MTSRSGSTRSRPDSATDADDTFTYPPTDVRRVSAPLPPQLSKNAQIGIVVVLLLTLAYSVVIAGQILLWFVLVGIAVGIYVAYLLVLAVFRMVDAVERLADAVEARNEAGQTQPSDGSSTSEKSDDAEAAPDEVEADADEGDSGAKDTDSDSDDANSSTEDTESDTGGDGTEPTDRGRESAEHRSDTDT